MKSPNACVWLCEKQCALRNAVNYIKLFDWTVQTLMQDTILSRRFETYL
jgi:hypothetical protein